MAVSTDSAEGFFEAASPFGALADWEPQEGGSPTKTRERASALGADGDEFRHADHDERDTVTANYVAKKTTGNFDVPAAGSVLNGYVVESVTVNYSQDFPTLALSGHKHTRAASGAHENMRTYSPSIDLPAVALGVPSEIGHVSCDGARSISYELTCNHIDEIGGDDTLVGADNHDGTETLTIESVCAITVDGTDADAGNWTQTNSGKNKTNNAATVNSLTLVKHLAHDTPSGT